MLTPGSRKKDSSSAPSESRSEMVKVSSMVTAFAGGYGVLADARKVSLETIETEADGTPTTNVAAAILTGILSSFASAMTSGISNLLSGFIKDEAIKFLSQRAMFALAGTGQTLANLAVTAATARAAQPAMKKRLFFIALEEEINAEVQAAEFAFLNAIYNSPDKLPEMPPESIGAQFTSAANAAQVLQYRESRRAWLVFQAQQKLGTSPNAGTPVADNAEKGGTRLGVDGSGGVEGVLQVELNEDDLTRVVRAELPGLGTIQAIDMSVTPLHDLGIPMRFVVEGGLGQTTYGIFVNEAGMAVVQGRTLERYLYNLGGGVRKIGEKEDVRSNERAFVDNGLKILVGVLMGQRLGSKLEL